MRVKVFLVSYLIWPQGNYKCPVCSKLFVRKDYYLRHVCRSPEGKVIQRPADIQLLTEGQADSRDYICSECGKSFCSMSSLSQHSKVRSYEYTSILLWARGNAKRFFCLPWKYKELERLKICKQEVKEVIRSNKDIVQCLWIKHLRISSELANFFAVG